MDKLIKCLEALNQRDFVDIFKQIFSEDTNVFTDIIQASIIAQQEIAKELEIDVSDLI